MSTQAKHTSAPWKFARKYTKRGLGPRCIIRDGEHEGIGAPTICTINGSEADARLIAAAPELLEALLAAESIVSAIECGGEKPLSTGQVLDDMRAAIAKATGPL